MSPKQQLSAAALCKHAPVGAITRTTDKALKAHFNEIIKKNDALAVYFHPNGTAKYHKLNATTVRQLKITSGGLSGLALDILDLVEKLYKLGIPICYSCAIEHMCIKIQEQKFPGTIWTKYDILFNLVPCCHQVIRGAVGEDIKQIMGDDIHENVMQVHAHFDKLIEIAKGKSKKVESNDGGDGAGQGKLEYDGTQEGQRHFDGDGVEVRDTIHVANR